MDREVLRGSYDRDPGDGGQPAQQQLALNLDSGTVICQLGFNGQKDVTEEAALHELTLDLADMGTCGIADGLHTHRGTAQHLLDPGSVFVLAVRRAFLGQQARQCGGIRSPTLRTSVSQSGNCRSSPGRMRRNAGRTRPRLRGGDCEHADQCAAYIERNRERVQYADFRAQWLCVPSGVVESGYKNVVGTRLKRSGMPGPSKAPMPSPPCAAEISGASTRFPGLTAPFATDVEQRLM